jgi:Zn-dependent peptidase ImmA (M78 family)
MTYRRGFRTEAERLAASTRHELGLGLYVRLDALRLAEHLDIPVWTLTELGQRQATRSLAQALTRLHGPDQAAVSAFTVFVGTRRVIVHNDSHAPGRQASNVMHELSHGLLLHPPGVAVDGLGCRDWDSDVEKEADYLGGALLVPSKAAWWIAKQRQPFEEAAAHYGCSVEMIRWRVNVTGARRLLAG